MWVTRRQLHVRFGQMFRSTSGTISRATHESETTEMSCASSKDTLRTQEIHKRWWSCPREELLNCLSQLLGRKRADGPKKIPRSRNGQRWPTSAQVLHFIATHLCLVAATFRMGAQIACFNITWHNQVRVHPWRFGRSEGGPVLEGYGSRFL